MSSILDALKRAEQNSTKENLAPPPWAAPSSTSYTHRQSVRRWLMAFACIASLGVLAVIAWQVRRPETKMPAVAVESAPPPDVHSVRPAKAAARKARTTPAMAKVQSTIPQRVVTPIRPARKASPAAMRQPPAKAKTAPIAQTQRPQRSVVAKSEPAIAHPAVQAQQTDENAHETRSDPRIDLQALVWSPDAAARFVIINNRLVKEGGSVDNIDVVRINRDDVQLSEGGNKWYAPFKIR